MARIGQAGVSRPHLAKRDGPIGVIDAAPEARSGDRACRNRTRTQARGAAGTLPVASERRCGAAGERASVTGAALDLIT